MATLEMEIPDEKIQELLRGDRGMAVLLEPILNHILQAEMTEHLKAEPGEQTDDRRGYRNGTYQRKLTTRVGTIELEVPRDREGTFQTALFQRYQRSEKALVLTLMQMVVQGVSTRRVKDITTELCGREFSKSTVSRLAEELDEQVEAWAERRLDREYPFLLLDAMQLKVRRQKAVRSTTAMLAVGISEDGQREILGLEMAFSETEEGWCRFIRQLKDRGLSGVELATSDAHEGLKQALQEAFPGLIWQRCQSHFRRWPSRWPSSIRRQPPTETRCTRCSTRSWRPTLRRRPGPDLTISESGWKRRLPQPSRPLRMASTTQLPCSLCRRSIANASARPTCWNASFRRSEDGRR